MAELGKEEEPAETEMISAVMEQLPPIDKSELDVRGYATSDQLNILTEPLNWVCNCLARSTTEISCTPITKMRIDCRTDNCQIPA